MANLEDKHNDHEIISEWKSINADREARAARIAAQQAQEEAERRAAEERARLRQQENE